MRHVVMENRHGLMVATEMTQATGTAERAAAQAMQLDQAHRHHGQIRHQVAMAEELLHRARPSRPIAMCPEAPPPAIRCAAPPAP